eukprot:7478402-Alexandrium_andersonii.AAC.1
MSASLVGSEMCIRDSCKRVAKVWQRCGKGVAKAWQNGHGCSQNKAYIIAVSYTHLTLPTICSV